MHGSSGSRRDAGKVVSDDELHLYHQRVDCDGASFFSVTVHVVRDRRRKNTTSGRRRQRSPIENRTNRGKTVVNENTERVGGGVVRGGNARRLPTRTRGQHGSRALSNSAIESRKKVVWFTGGRTVVTQTILGDATRRLMYTKI